MARRDPAPLHWSESYCCADGPQKGAPMLGFVFGLNARLGRLQFFLASIALAIVMTLICFLIAMATFKHASPSAIRAEDMLRSWPVLGAAGLFGVATFMLQSMRIRDI